MFFLLHSFSALFYIIGIIYTCQFFTNAIEHLGAKLKLSNGAVGSILAVVGTSLPETIVPLVAIFGALIFKTNVDIGQNVAAGAIIGSPFMLNTFALFVLGFSILFLKIFKRRELTSLNLDYKNILRDCRYFILGYLPAILCVFLNDSFKHLVVFYLLILYFVFVYRTIIKSKQNYSVQELEKLIILKLSFLFKKVTMFAILLQIFLSLIALVVFSHFFVREIETFSNALNISPLILSLIITPFATELPECVNSIIWVNSSKDDLAISNILGGTIFQATITASIGIMFTSWKPSSLILVNAFLVIFCVLLFMFNIILNKKVNMFSLLLCGAFYLCYLFYLIN